MGIEVELKDLADKIKSSRNIITSEEHTKMAYIVPFIKMLGYDVFNPTEVIPEYTCDFGVKKGEKVDYAICIDSNPYIIIECKDCRASLTKSNISQLYRYFSVSSAKIAILTNGIEYLLFTDSEEQNKMDYTPFYSFNILDYSEDDISLLTKLRKENIKTSDILSQPKLLMFKNEFISWIVSQQIGVSNKFIQYIRKSLNTFSLSNYEISDVISDVLSSYSFDEAQIKTDNMCNIEQKRNITASGVTGVFSLSDESLASRVSGSQVVYFKIFNKIYNCDKFYLLYNILLDYCFDVLNISEDTIENMKLSRKIYYKKESEVKGSNIKFHRNFYYNAGVSAQYLLKCVIEFCDILSLSKSDLYLCLLSKKDYNSFKVLDDLEKNKFLSNIFDDFKR